MTQYEMVEKLSEKMNVTLEAAKAALEASDWELLDAALLLEKQRGEAGQGAYSTRPEPEAQSRREKARAQRRGGLLQAHVHLLGKLLCHLVMRHCFVLRSF